MKLEGLEKQYWTLMFSIQVKMSVLLPAIKQKLYQVKEKLFIQSFEIFKAK